MQGFINSANAGGLFTAESPGREGPEKFYAAFEQNSGGTALLLSSRWDEFSLEDDQLRSGVFSHFLLRGLNGESDFDGNKVITITELFQYIDYRVRLYTNLVQTPFLTGNFDRTMPVAAVRSVWSAPQPGF